MGSALVAAAVADLGEGVAVYCHADAKLRTLYETAGFGVLVAPPVWMAAEHEALETRRRKRGGAPLLLMGLGEEVARTPS